MESWDRLPEEAEPDDHLVQLYGRDHQLLAGSVGRYFRVGLRRGEGLLAIASMEHCSAFARELRKEPGYQAAVGEGRLVFLDAELVLAQSMGDGQLILDLVQTAILSAMQEMRARVGRARIRAYGELVGILWTAGRIEEAVQLEHYWNRLLRRNSFSLFCGYPIDRLDPDAPSDGLSAVLSAHTHVVTADRHTHPARQAEAFAL